MGEIGEFVKTTAQRDGLADIQMGVKFSLSDLKPSRDDTLTWDYTFRGNTLLSATAIPLVQDADVFAIEFNISADKPAQFSTPGEPISGEVGESLLLVAEKPDDKKNKFRVSKGRIEDLHGARIVIFDQWHPMQNLARKPELMSKIRQNQLKQTQPLTVEKSTIRALKFIFI